MLVAISTVVFRDEGSTNFETKPGGGGRKGEVAKSIGVIDIVVFLAACPCTVHGRRAF